ncbi:MAG: phosphodiester glycosidase family protein [Clostridia bacterium]|nr:phosphodiester glycosidase family protein [Clostridia bacterium]
MKRAALIGLTVILLLSILVMVPSEMSLAEIVEIPLDKTKMDDVDPAYYLADVPLSNVKKRTTDMKALEKITHLEYQDPSLHITLDRGEWMAPNRVKGTDELVRTQYWVVRIQLANATQIRTGLGSRNGKTRESNYWWYDHYNPVLAINGDGFGDNFNGYGRHIVRQGKVLKSNASGNKDGFNGFDALIIDDQGDFHIIRYAKEADFDAFEGNIVNCFSFGPALVMDGELVTELYDGVRYKNMIGAEIPARRICIAQTGPLSYMIVQSDGPEDPDKSGLWLSDFAELVYSLGDVQIAYNLDGGASTRILFHGGQVECPYVNTKSQRRANGDMILFASAWQE